MKIERLKTNNLPRNIIIGVIVIALITTLILNFTRAKYRTTQSIPLINGTITFNNADLNVIAMYQENEAGEYVSVDTAPTSEYILNSSESYCEVNGEKDTSISLNYDITTQALTVTPMTDKGTKCYLYFDIYVLSEVILADKTIQERIDFSTILTTNTNGTIYQAPDGDGTSYYFAGNTTENWLSFAGFYWRIIRINGDGTVRIIYNGTSTTDTGSQLPSASAFNSSYNNNMYVGYMYTSGQVHGLGSSSAIKRRVDEWYQDNIEIYSEYTSKISTTTGFCGDRTSTTTNGGAPNDTGGTGTTTTYYGAMYRLTWNKIPTYDCPDPDNDLYTVDGAGIGNEALTYPVGLITADEAAYAGGADNSNGGYYLHTGSAYWTMSPAHTNSLGVYSYVFRVASDGSLDHDNFVTYSLGVRPVLNLRSDVVLIGTGSSTDPFVVVS